MSSSPGKAAGKVGGRPKPPPSAIASGPLPVLIGAVVGLALLGFVVGGAASFFQARTIGGGARLPVGAVFAVIVLGAVAFSASVMMRSKLGIGGISLGWVISVLVFTAGRPEGDVIIAADLPGYGYLFGGVLVLGVLSTLPYSAIPAPASE